QSSTLYSTNLFRLAEELCKTKDGVINVNMEDDAIRGLTVIKEGAITWPAPPIKLAAPPAAAKPAVAVPAAKKGHGHGGGAPMAGGKLAIMFAVAAVAFWFIGANAPAAFLGHFTVFVLACFVGYMVVWNVTPALHTPLMSVTNAISSIIVIGALVQIAPPALADAGLQRPDDMIRWLAVAGIALTAINMFGGFAVTQRMLAMFLAYIGATILFILSLGGLSNPETSRRGNLYGIIGMTIAVLATVLGPRVTAAGIPWIVGAMVAGGSIGLYLARTVQMTQMPELVAFMHSLVGLAAVVVGFASYVDPTSTLNLTSAEKAIHELEVYIGVFIGAVTLSGSVIAFGKLSGKISGKPLLLPARHWLNLLGHTGPRPAG
ncbi:unnamed protein product, partial [Phaeothamnion confervicola]